MLLTNIDIDRILRRNPVTRRIYKGCFPSNQLPKIKSYPAAMVVNFDDSSEPGTHWAGLFARTPVHVFYFDSLGLGEEYTEDIKEYIRTNFATSTKQHIGLQRAGTTVCGHYALFFIYCCAKNIPFLQVESLLSTRRNPDQWVRNFVCDNLVK